MSISRIQMKIKISDSTRISAIQEIFHKNFPYLKIEFFSKPHKPGNPGVKNFIKPPQSTLAECRTNHLEGEISIVSDMSVKDLEQQFLHHYGLFVQVFRKSGNIWLETTVTDNWTLEQQNTQGEEMSRMGYWKKDSE